MQYKPKTGAADASDDSDDDDDDFEDDWQPDKKTAKKRPRASGGRAARGRGAAAAAATGGSSSDSESDSDAEVAAGDAGLLEPAAVMALLREAAGCSQTEEGGGGAAAAAAAAGATLSLGELERACGHFEQFRQGQKEEEVEKEVRYRSLWASSALAPCLFHSA